MPRSGTSLVEQILSSHKKVFGGGELVFLNKIIKKNFLTSETFKDAKINENKIIMSRNEYYEKISFLNIKICIIKNHLHMRSIK